MKASVVLVLVLVAASCGFLEKKGEVVTCTESFKCGEDDASNPATKTFCTDPDDKDRAGQITQFQKDFAADCGGVNVTCSGGVHDGEAAVCSAACVAKGECDFDPVPQAVVE